MNDFATIVTAIASFGVTALLGLWAVPFLRRIKYGQTIKAVSYTHLDVYKRQVTPQKKHV